MQNTYVVRLQDRKLICFYYEYDVGIVYKVYENNSWSKTETIFRNALEHFSVTLAYDGIIYIFCQDKNGNLFLCNNKEGVWRSRNILENQSKNVHTILFHPIITESGMTLIYNVPATNSNKSTLVSHTLQKDGSWTDPTTIDQYINMSECIYQIQPIAMDHVILFYQNRSNELKLGYRELTSTLQGPFNVFHSTAYQIKDQSFLTTYKDIHCLYVVKSFFSSQLVYRKKNEDGYSKPLVLWEGQRIENCLLMIVRNQIIACFISNGQLVQCVSTDDGNSFSRPEVSKEKFAPNCAKAFFISQNPLDESNYFTREIYVDQYKPWDIQLLPSMVNDFYPVVLKTVEPQHQATSRAPETTYSETPNENEYIEKIIEYKEYASKAKNQLVMTQKQLSEKDHQIINLTTLLKNKNEEIGQLIQELNNHGKKNNDQVDSLTIRVMSLESENKKLKEELSTAKQHKPSFSSEPITENPSDITTSE